MIVRPALAADAAVLAAVHRTAFEVPWDEASIAGLLAMPGAFAFTVGTVPSPTGFILCRAAADEAEILTLATVPGHRRRGLAAALLDAAALEAAARGATVLCLEVAADNPVAGALYAKAGFVAAGARRGYYARAGGAVDAVILRRELNR